MESYKVQTATISCDYPENVELNKAIAMFAKSLWEEGFLNISTKYDKETGEIFRELSISANRNIYD